MHLFYVHIFIHGLLPSKFGISYDVAVAQHVMNCSAGLAVPKSRNYFSRKWVSIEHNISLSPFCPDLTEIELKKT